MTGLPETTRTPIRFDPELVQCNLRTMPEVLAFDALDIGASAYQTLLTGPVAVPFKAESSTVSDHEIQWPIELLAIDESKAVRDPCSRLRLGVHMHALCATEVVSQ